MTKTIARIPLVAPGPGTARHLSVHRYGTPGARPKAYLQASLHADEIPPMLVLNHLMRRLDAADRAGRIRGEIILVPVANPIGAAQVINLSLVGRYDMSGGGNFNRNWPDLFEGLVEGLAERVEGQLTDDPDRNVAIVRAAMIGDLAQRATGSEMASLRLALARLAVDADIVLDCHCDSEALVHLFLIPAHWPAAADLAADTGSRAALLAADSGGRSFDEALSTPWTRLAATLPDRPIPPACFAATIEYRGQADVADELAEADAAGLFRFLQRRGAIAGEPGPLPAALCEATALAACDVPRVPTAGIIAYKQPLGAMVAAGSLIAELIDPMADDPESARVPIRAATTGLLLSRRADHLVRPGDSIAKIAGKEPLPHRRGYLLED